MKLNISEKVCTPTFTNHLRKKIYTCKELTLEYLQNVKIEYKEAEVF